MPDFERPMRSLELHLCTTDVERAYVQGKHDGLSQARMECAYLVGGAVIGWFLFSSRMSIAAGAFLAVFVGLGAMLLAWRLSRKAEPLAFRTVDGGHLAPYPGMTDQDLYEFEQTMNVPNRTFSSPPRV